MLKRKITATEHGTLSAEVQKFYLLVDGHYMLQADDATELNNALDREKLRANGLQIQVTALTGQVTSLTADNTDLRSKKADVLSVETSFNAQIAGLKLSHTTQLAAKDKQLHKVLVTNTAASLAKEMAGDNAHLLQPIIEQRLLADSTGDDAVVKILGPDGKPSALKLEELQKELVDSGKYKAILVTSKASGSAGHTNTTRPEGIPQDKKFKDLTQAERIEWNKSDPDGFAKASAESRQVV